MAGFVTVVASDRRDGRQEARSGLTGCLWLRFRSVRSVTGACEGGYGPLEVRRRSRGGKRTSSRNRELRLVFILGYFLLRIKSLEVRINTPRDFIELL